MIEQLSIFAENSKGAMHKITRILLDNNINMNTLITNDSAEFGIIRMLVSDPEAAKAALEGKGYLARVDKALAIEISDECGSLHNLLDIMSRGNINLDYLYVTYSSLSKFPIAIIKVDDIYEVEEFLEGKGYTALNTVEK